MKVIKLALSIIAGLGLIFFLILWLSTSSNLKEAKKTLAETHERLASAEKTAASCKTELNQTSSLASQTETKLKQTAESLAFKETELKRQSDSLNDLSANKDRLEVRNKDLETKLKLAENEQKERQLLLLQVAELTANLTVLSGNNQKLIIERDQALQSLEVLKDHAVPSSSPPTETPLPSSPDKAIDPSDNCAPLAPPNEPKDPPASSTTPPTSDSLTAPTTTPTPTAPIEPPKPPSSDLRPSPAPNNSLIRPILPSPPRNQINSRFPELIYI
ncbi:MAG: hypothetical protein LBV23_05215 [Deltaproteobacteria bacterium]|jgi:hypothetical protein|nr:hypothetical protein [Deltaproteobacteria bacterium]